MKKGVTRETETETGASKWVAVKEISTRRLNRKLLRSLESEIDVLRSCEHENIIALLDIVKDEPNQTVFLVLEHCALGDLSQYLRRVRRVAEPVARTFAAQIAGGLREMRARNLIHRDLKPQNLLLCRTPATDVRAEVKSRNGFREGVARLREGRVVYLRDAQDRRLWLRAVRAPERSGRDAVRLALVHGA